MRQISISDINFNELQMKSIQFRSALIDFYKDQMEYFVKLNEDELDEYVFDKLRSCDKDKDEVEIERKFSYYKKLNEINPIKLRMDYNDWNGIPNGGESY
tara:strand:- start:767 stop:1066 length:300 start_codon:yes stop_codon:yes gene_type:complete